jgi:uncharacterized protein with ParB-like and HNH nuclease domain
MEEKASTTEVEEQILEIQADYKYRLAEFTIGELNRKFYQRGEEITDIDEEMSILFVPKYQRDFVWSELMQSRFIESIFMGVPIQPLFAFELNDEGNLELLDGVQRLSTVKSFSDNKLILNNLEEITTLNNYQFEHLEASRKRKFLNTSLKVYIINENTDEGVRADIFRRINETGKKLESAEIRKGKFIANEFYDFILKCAEFSEFSELFSSAKNKEKLRGEKEELITRFFAFSDNYKNFVHSVKGFMDDYIIEKGKTYTTSIADEKEKEFKNMLNFVKKYIPNGFTKSEKSLSIPRVRFEAISVGVNLALKENPNLINPNIQWIESQEFKQWTTSDASNNKNKLIGRIEFVRDCLLSKIESNTLQYEK